MAKDKPAEIVIESKRGALWWAFVVVGGGLFFMFLLTSFAALTSRNFGDFTPISLLALVISLGYPWLLVLTLQIRISKDMISARCVWGANESRWKDVQDIKTAPGWGITNLAIGDRVRRYNVYALPFANRDQIVQAALEAAWIKHRKMVFPASLERRHGKPPYGVFVPKKN